MHHQEENIERKKRVRKTRIRVRELQLFINQPSLLIIIEKKPIYKKNINCN